jgi:hypothetical protein
MKTTLRPARRAAFTLIELLVTNAESWERGRPGRSSDCVVNSLDRQE